MDLIDKPDLSLDLINESARLSEAAGKRMDAYDARAVPPLSQEEKRREEQWPTVSSGDDTSEDGAASKP